MKSVLVTGGSRGIGLAVCARLLESGVRVTTVSRSPTSKLDQLASQYGSLLHMVHCDLSQDGAIEIINRQADLTGGVDGLVANAAIGSEGLLTLQSRRQIDTTLQVNLRSVLLLTRAVIKGMLLRGGGSIVFVCSIAAIRGFSGLSVYGATKGALCAFSRSIAREYGPRHIRSNCVLPGFVSTDMSASLGDTQRSRISRRTPLRRLGTPEEVAAPICFLLGTESGFITGSELVVDGGMAC